MNTRVSHFSQNTQAVIASDVIARAVISVGEVLHIVSVYADSTNIEFFFVNEEGKRAGTFHKDSGPYKDFNSFIHYYANRIKGTIESFEIYSPLDLIAITMKPKHFTVSADWTPRINSIDPRDYRIVNRKLQAKSRSTPMFWSGRK